MWFFFSGRAIRLDPHWQRFGDERFNSHGVRLQWNHVGCVKWWTGYGVPLWLRFSLDEHTKTWKKRNIFPFNVRGIKSALRVAPEVKSKYIGEKRIFTAEITRLTVASFTVNVLWSGNVRQYSQQMVLTKNVYRFRLATGASQKQEIWQWPSCIYLHWHLQAPMHSLGFQELRDWRSSTSGRAEDWKRPVVGRVLRNVMR